MRAIQTAEDLIGPLAERAVHAAERPIVALSQAAVTAAAADVSAVELAHRKREQRQRAGHLCDLVNQLLYQPGRIEGQHSLARRPFDDLA
jgi:hypothetical protein